VIRSASTKLRPTSRAVARGFRGGSQKSYAFSTWCHEHVVGWQHVIARHSSVFNTTLDRLTPAHGYLQHSCLLRYESGSNAWCTNSWATTRHYVKSVYWDPAVRRQSSLVDETQQSQSAPYNSAKKQLEIIQYCGSRRRINSTAKTRQCCPCHICVQYMTQPAGPHSFGSHSLYCSSAHSH
jgi:hypothetical protein